MQNYLISESLVNTVALYIIIKKLLSPFEKWDACKLGIIDAKGKKLKAPKSGKERDAWDLLTRFCWNFKLIINKIGGNNKIVPYLSAALLLRDSINHYYIEENLSLLNETLLSDMTFAKQNLIYELIQESPDIKEKITEDNFEFYMYLFMPKIEKLIEKYDIKELI